jgi:flagellar basal-body rod protein FlgG
MIRAMWTAASGMGAQQLLIDVTANNLANVNTTSFKKSRPEFEDLFYQIYQDKGGPTTAGGNAPVGVEVGMGTRPSAVQKIFTQGDFMETKNNLDLAIEGKGFFLVDSDGTDTYTRDGAFKVDSNGNVVNARGELLQPAITIPTDTANITVNKKGELTCLDSGGNTLTTVQLQIYNFINEAGLSSLGGNSYVATPASGDAIQGTPGDTNFGTIAQGTLEMSNVDAVEEMIAMIVGQRAYDMNSKAIQTADSMLQTVTQLVR